jgi:hypothetical protein
MPSRTDRGSLLTSEDLHRGRKRPATGHAAAQGEMAPMKKPMAGDVVILTTLKRASFYWQVILVFGMLKQDLLLPPP